jgi:predicted enzyme related to lactoylglutathione lyase
MFYSHSANIDNQGTTRDSPLASDCDMTIKNAFASVAVKDLKAAGQWYEKLFGRPADSKPMSEVAEWKFPGGGWLQVYALPERAGGCSFTLAVSNLDDEHSKLKKLGIDTTPMALQVRKSKRS